MKYLLCDRENIYNYEITITKKEEVLNSLKECAEVKHVKFQTTAPYTTACDVLLKKLNYLYDEIIDYEFQETKTSDIRSENAVEVTVIATVKKYPVLYHVLSAEDPFIELVDYLENQPFTKTTSFSVLKLLKGIKKKRRNQYDDNNISIEDKLNMIEKYMASLQFNLLQQRSISNINKSIEVLKSMEYIPYQKEFLSALRQEIKSAQKNMEIMFKIYNLMNKELYLGENLKMVIKKNKNGN